MYPTTRKTVTGQNGAVASSHELASEAAAKTLAAGGNAFDASVVAAFILQVVEPHQVSPGGEAVILGLKGPSGSPFALCGQGYAPAAAAIDHFRGLGHKIIPKTGVLTAAVPGGFGAWLSLLREHGTWSLEQALTPAIAVGAQGIPVGAELEIMIEKYAEAIAAHWPDTAAVFLPGGRPPKRGATLHNKRLVETLSRLIIKGQAAGASREGQIEAAICEFYTGFVADSIVGFMSAERPDLQGSFQRGVMTGDDLARWQPSAEPALRYDFRGVSVYKAGSWSQGPVMLQVLALAADLDFGAMTPLSATYVHELLERMKLAFADREAWYGDAPHNNVPFAALLDEDYVAERRSLIGGRACETLRPGAVGGTVAQLPQGAVGDKAMPDWFVLPDILPQHGDTCHLDVADAAGNLVSATLSGGWLHGSPIIPELGFALNTRLEMNWLDPGSASALAPHRRPRTSLSPTIACRDGEPFMAFGATAADFQDQWSTQLLLYLLYYEKDLQTAMDAPMFLSQHWPQSYSPRYAAPASLIVDRRYSDETRAALAQRGHRVQVRDIVPRGRLFGVMRDQGRFSAAAGLAVPQSAAYAV
jgi:gamma-glutamyltranspeptidase/glutathione hydrolase